MIVKCKKSEKICIEWAKDFEVMGWMKEGEKYRNLANSFSLGTEPKINIISEIKNLEGRIACSEIALKGIQGIIPDKKARKTSNKIIRETHFILEKLRDLTK